MAQCRMPLAENKTCNEQIYSCKVCKSSGCKNRVCRNMCFDGMRCLRCGENSATS